MQEAILPTYKAILRGDRLEWRGTSRQHPPTDRPIAVHVTLLDEPLSETDVREEGLGARMAASLERLAEIHALQERQHFEAFFAASSVLPLSQDVLEQAVTLRQLRKMTLGDALVAGTALVHGLTLVTRNTSRRWLTHRRKEHQGRQILLAFLVSWSTICSAT